MAIVSTLTLYSWYDVKEATQSRNTEYFKTLVTDTEEALVNRYLLYQQSLLGGVGVFYASGTVNRHEWLAYVNAVDIEKNLPGINGIGFITATKEENLSSFLARTRQDDASNFTNHPETTYSDKFIITFIEPTETNQSAVGLDIGFEANRRSAAEHARDFGVPALTRKIQLVQDQKSQAGFLLLLPIYDTNNTPPTINERREHLVGWVYAPFIGSNFLQGLSEIRQNQLGFDVYDGEEMSPDALIFSTHQDMLEANKDAMLTEQTTITLAERVWTIHWHSTDSISLPGNQSLSTIILSFGLIFSLLLYYTLSNLLLSKQTITTQVESQTEKLRYAFKELELVNKELEKFAYVASHDLKAPMRGIDNLAKWIAEDLEEVMDEDARDKIKLLRQRIARLETLLEDILSYSRAGRIVDEPEEINVDLLVRDTLDSLTLPDGFHVAIPQPLPIIYSVRTPLQQVFLNLITNACKHHDKTQGNISITFADRDQYYEFTVQDDGPGIPEEFQDRVFEMFQTLQSRDKTEGTGLGMAIIKKLVEWQDGSVWIESINGERGTAVKFLWPKTYKAMRMQK